MNSFYTYEELEKIGFKTFGKNVLISRKTSVYGAENIQIGDNVRIDDFCILSGKIEFGNNIHIAAGSMLFGGEYGIIFDDFTGISSRCAIYAISDDYSGISMTNPTIPDEYRKVIGGKVILHKHVVIGSGCTILPNTTIGEGTSVGSMSLVNRSLNSWGIYVGIPCKRIKERNKKVLDLEQKYQFKYKAINEQI